ncbi:hypothetical protein [Chloroflexus sp.]|uniref:hypothetical protein n=1 Tax=Chloroflexus sp. TaxID=1904827 RepID=UPI002ACEBCF4|nr:hypothetical protein [Chloroflexus sp.]
MQVLRRCFVSFILVSLLGIVSLIGQPVTAQSGEPYMQLNGFIERTGEVSVDIAQLPATIHEVRWSWNQPPAVDAAWEPLNVFRGYAIHFVKAPPDTGNPLCQHHTLYAELRDQNGDTILLSEPFTIDRSLDMLVNIAWPSYAMAGYTNQDEIMVQFIDNQDCSGILTGYLVINEDVFHNLLITPPSQPAPFRAYRLSLAEGEMIASVSGRDRQSNVAYQTITFVRDVTPPTLADTRVAINTTPPDNHLVITGQFADAYAPLPWAIEWQFMNRDGTMIGDPVYHILNPDEVQSSETALLSANSTPFRISVGLGSIPAHAVALRVKLFDRAGNGQAIDPIQLTLPNSTFNIYVPLIKR